MRDATPLSTGDVYAIVYAIVAPELRRYQPQESCQQVGERLMWCMDLMKGNEG